MARIRATRVLAFAATASAILALTGCTANPTPTFTPHAGPINIVTSVGVWANIAKQVGGSQVRVSSVIHSSMQDPHSYTASARDQLLVNQADVTLANGLGYDDFFVTLTKAAPKLDPKLRLRAWCVGECAREGNAGSADELTGNPHLWYHLASVQASVKKLQQGLQRALYTETESQKLSVSAGKFAQALAVLANLEHAVSPKVAGRGALLTEGFAQYLLADLGMKNLTPVEYRNAVENEQDVSPGAMNQMRQLLKNHKVSVVITNRQTQTAQTLQLEAWAKQSGVPVLRLTESLPAGKNYQIWMRSNILNIRNAVTGK